MNRLKLIITERAKTDLIQITRFIAKDNKKAAKDFSLYFYEICLKLADFPQIGVLRPDFTNKNYRFFIIKNHYIIVYKTDNKNLYIARFLTGWQDICGLL